MVAVVVLITTVTILALRRWLIHVELLQELLPDNPLHPEMR